LTTPYHSKGHTRGEQRAIRRHRP